MRFIAQDSYIVLDGGLDLSMKRETSSRGGVLDLRKFLAGFYLFTLSNSDRLVGHAGSC